jgi:4-amino-4-deoxy-L-arabinose transferase-like glycosyltransferase
MSLNYQLALVCALSTVLRVGAALYMGSQVTALPGIHDQISYDALAQRVVGGHGFSFDQPWYPFTPADTPTAHWSFLYTLWLAGIYAIFDHQPLVARLLQAVIAGVATPVLVYRLGARVADRNVALVAALLAAIYGYFIYYAAALMTEAIYTLLVLLSLELAMGLVKSATWRSWAVFGLVVSVAVLLRQVFAPIAALLVLWVLWRGNQWRQWWRATIPLVILVASIAPWTIRNYTVYEVFLPLNSNVGYVLYSSLHPSHGVEWDDARAVVPIPAPWLREYNEAQLSNLLTAQGVQYIVQDPLRIAHLTLNKSLEFFRFLPSEHSEAASNLTRTASFGVLLPLALWGLYRSRRNWKTYSLLYVFGVAYAGIHVLSWPSPRYRLPIDGTLLVFGAIALLDLGVWWRAWMAARAHSQPGLNRRSLGSPQARPRILSR